MDINGKKINFVISKKSNAKKFEQALKEMEKREASIRNNEHPELSDLLDEVLDMFKQFFIEATGVDVVGDCDDATEVKEMYEEFLGAVKKQSNAFTRPFSLDRIK